jgi:hypothetical protein
MRVRRELYATSRRDAGVEVMSIRGPAKRYQIGRDTVRQALSDPVPLAPGKQPKLSKAQEAHLVTLHQGGCTPRARLRSYSASLDPLPTARSGEEQQRRPSDK